MPPHDPMTGFSDETIVLMLNKCPGLTRWEVKFAASLFNWVHQLQRNLSDSQRNKALDILDEKYKPRKRNV